LIAWRVAKMSNPDQDGNDDVREHRQQNIVQAEMSDDGHVFALIEEAVDNTQLTDAEYVKKRTAAIYLMALNMSEHVGGDHAMTAGQATVVLGAIERMAMSLAWRFKVSRLDFEDEVNRQFQANIQAAVLLVTEPKGRAS